jgi:hypothetical protein
MFVNILFCSLPLLKKIINNQEVIKTVIGDIVSICPVFFIADRS